MRRLIVTVLLVLGSSAPGAPLTRPGRLAVGVTTADTLDETRGNRNKYLAHRKGLGRLLRPSDDGTVALIARPK